MKSKILSVAAAALMFAACNEPLNDAVENLEKDSNESESVSTKSHWGNKINDPYTVSNMRLAFKELMKKGNNSLSKAGVSEQQIEPTHLHLKFIPKNEEELDLLKEDTILNTVPVPFDYDLEGFNGDYRDPECPINQPTYQYSVVRINHKLPDVEYVVLDSLFMPFEDDYDQETISKKSGFRQIWDELEDESLKITGNYDEELHSISKKSRITPDGYVRMTDFSLGQAGIGVPNVKIHMNFSTHQATTHTNANGYYKMSHSFKNKLHTHVYFENGNYCAENDNNDVIAYYRGRISPDRINYTFDERNEENYAATIMKAGYDYFNNISGIEPPPSNKFFHIGAKAATKLTTFYGSHDGKRTYISELLCGQNREIYAMTIYGLAYQSYRCFNKQIKEKDPTTFHTMMNESYLVCIMWLLTPKVYSDFDINAYIDKSFRSTGFFIDMIDEIDSSNGDEVSGYLINDIEVLMSRHNATVIRDYPVLMPQYFPNETEGNLYKLAEKWYNWLGYKL